jgi:hypothetical protein
MAVNLSMPVFVVDDFSTMTRIIRNLLEQIGFEDIDERRAAPDDDASQEIWIGRLGLELAAEERLTDAPAGSQ